jgi:hypothetical protein
VQLSAAKGAFQVTAALHELVDVGTTMLDGTLVHTGLWLSVTVMVKAAVATRPLMSVAVYVTTVVPTGNKAPGLKLLTNKVPEQLSVTVGTVHVTGAVHKPELAATVMFEGTWEMTGSRSTTNTQNPAVSALPFTSVAVYRTRVRPTPKKLPGVAVGAKLAMPQLSVAVGAFHVTAVPQVVAPLMTVMLAGMLAMIGFWLSTTVTVKEPVVVLLLLSRAV